jgi:hypothetical protein
VFALLLISVLVNAATLQKSQLNSALLCPTCEAVISEARKDIYKFSTGKKAPSRVQKTMDRLCKRFENGYAVITDNQGKKTVSKFEGNISGSLEMSQKVSVDITEICMYLVQEYADEFVEAFQEYDQDKQDELCTTVSECMLFFLI